MGMTIDEAIRDLIYLKNCGIFPFSYGTNGKQLTIATDECIAIAIDTMRKYQMFQLDYEARLKADLEAILVELQLEIEEMVNPFGTRISGCSQDGWKHGVKNCDFVIQQKIDKLRGDENEQ